MKNQYAETIASIHDSSTSTLANQWTPRAETIANPNDPLWFTKWAHREWRLQNPLPGDLVPEDENALVEK